MSIAVRSATTALGLVLAATAHIAQAQDAPAQPAQPESRADVLSDGDIVVTARKREERSQTVPIAISAFSGASLTARGIDKVDGIATISPNMSFQNNPSFGGASASAAIYIRGIGQKEFLPTTEPGVGVYVDGVYVARSVGALLDLVDVERVEVLRGPQGTLFGRNTIGGAVSLTTVKPNGTLAAAAHITGGNFNRIDAKGTINLPLTDTLFARLALANFSRDGYVTRTDGKDLGNVNTKTGRLQLRWKPSNDFEVNLSLEGTDDKTNGPALVMNGINYGSAIFNPGNLPVLPPGSAPRAGFYVANPPFDAPVDNFALLNNYFATFLGGQPCLAFAPAYSPTGPGAACFNNSYVSTTSDKGTSPQYSRNKLWAASGTIDWNLGPVQLKSITAYRDLDGSFARDGDHSPLTIAEYADTLTDQQFSQELQLLGDGFDKRLKYVFGLFYFNEKGNNVNTLNFTPVNFTSGGRFKTKSYAAFGQATWTFGDAVDLTAGLRYTKDEKSFLPDQLILLDRTGGALIAGSPNTPKTRVLPFVTVNRNESDLTPMANLAWHVDKDVLLYASFSKGFKSGGFVQRVFPPLAATPVFGAEKATAYEVGFKSQFFNRRLTINGAAFYTKYDNLQVQVFTGVAPVTKNAAAADIRGAELEAHFAAGDGWYVEGSVGYLDPKYTQIDPAAVEITTASKFERVSKWSLSASLLKSIDLGKSGSLTPRIDWSYRSSFFMDALNTPQLFQPGYSVFNASIAYDAPGGHLSLIGGITNLTDKRYTQTGVYGSSFDVYEQLYARPREWYLTAKWKL